MDPISLMITGTALAATGSLVSGEAGAQAAETNAAIADQNVGVSQARTAMDVGTLRRGIYKQLGGIRAATGASGVSLGGSSEDVLADSASQGEWDVFKRQYAGELEAMGFKNEAAMNRTRAKTSRVSGLFNAGANALLGYGRAANPSPSLGFHDYSGGGKMYGIS